MAVPSQCILATVPSTANPLPRRGWGVLCCISGGTRFKSFDEDLLTHVERVDKAILEQLPASLDAQAILSLPLASDPLLALDGEHFFLVFLLCV